MTAAVRSGEVLVITLENGSFGLAQVLVTGSRRVGVVLSSRVGPRPRRLEGADLLPHLREPSMSPDGTRDGPPVVATRWVSLPLPGGLGRLGVATPPRLPITAHAAGWDNLASVILVHWLRATAPKKARALLARWRAEEAKVRREQAKQEKQRIAALTLEGLAEGPVLASWNKRYPPKVVAQARRILRSLAREIGATPVARLRMEALRRGVERFNALDGARGFRILTTEREDLCAAFLDVTRTAKMKTGADPTSRWRDW